MRGVEDRCPVKTIWSGIPCGRPLVQTDTYSNIATRQVRATYACGHVLTLPPQSVPAGVKP